MIINVSLQQPKLPARLKMLAVLIPIFGLILCFAWYRSGKPPQQTHELLLGSLLGIGQYIVIGGIVLLASHYFKQTFPKF